MTRRPRFLRATHLMALAVLLGGSAHQASAQAYMLGDLFDRVNSADSILQFGTKNPELHARLVRMYAAVREQRAEGISLDSAAAIFAGDLNSHSFSTILRVDRDKFSETYLTIVTASIDSTLRITNQFLVRDVTTIIGQPARKTLFAPKDSFDVKLALRARDLNLERVRRFSVKYGPDAPRLNLAEAGLNYAAQIVLPRFFLSDDGGPAPWELVAKYSTTNLTASKTASDSATELHIVTSAQAGLRWYSFSKDCGQGNQLEKILNPCQVSGGLFVMGAKDAPLLNLFTAPLRKGVYLSALNYRIGFIPGADRRFVFGLENQVLPYVF